MTRRDDGKNKMSTEMRMVPQRHLPKIATYARVGSPLPANLIWTLPLKGSHRAFQSSVMEMLALTSPELVLDLPGQPSVKSIALRETQLGLEQHVVVGVNLAEGVIIVLSGRRITEVHPFDGELKVYDIYGLRHLGEDLDDQNQAWLQASCLRCIGTPFSSDNAEHIAYCNLLIDVVVNEVHEAALTSSPLVPSSLWSNDQIVLAHALAKRVGVKVKSE